MNKNINTKIIRDNTILIYFDGKDDMKLAGDYRKLLDKEKYIKASIKHGRLALTTVDKFDLTDDKSTFFPHISDCEFQKFMLNYCILKHVPGVCLMDTGSEFVDLRYTEADLKKIVNDLAYLPVYNDKPAEISNITDIYFNMNEYAPKDCTIESLQCVIKKGTLADMMRELKEGNLPDQEDFIEALIDRYNDLIDKAARCAYRRGFNAGSIITNGILAMPAGKCRIEIDDDEDRIIERFKLDDTCIFEEDDDFEYE